MVFVNSKYPACTYPCMHQLLCATLQTCHKFLGDSLCKYGCSHRIPEIVKYVYKNYKDYIEIL